MNSEHTTPRKPLRLWPGVAIAIVQLLVMFGAPVVAPDAELPIGMIGGIVGALLVILWWLFFSRARWFERVGALVLMIVAVFAARSVAHESITGAGQGFLIYILPVPSLSCALVAWAVATRSVVGGARLASLAAAILLAAAPFTVLRTSGVMGGAGSVFHWRWTPTPEERLLAQAKEEPMVIPPAPAPAAPAEIAKESPEAKTADAKPAPPPPALAPAEAKTEPSAPGTAAPATVPAMSERASGEAGRTRAEWPGFRGPGRDSIIRGVSINTDWSASPPVQIWRRPIGPGWSSFAVHGDLLYTQEQRGNDELVACYSVSTGKPVWLHRDAARFYESNGGAGPRGTPTLSNGRVYTLGATGIMNALDAGTGAVAWSHNAATDTEVPVPFWGLSSSPLVLDAKVIVAVSGAIIAYDADTGERRWLMKSRGGSYSSPHVMTIDGVPQILLMGGRGTTSISPADGTVLWENAWVGAPMVQPASLPGGDVLVTTADAMGGLGVRRLGVSQGPGGWTVEERWTSRGLKPYFNDFVIHKGHSFGFDGSILSSVDMADGTRKWKGGRYGNGQLVLLADQDVLLVISEEGELALVSATPDKFTELARFPVFTAKTWNHPVLVGDTLLVRNGEEMAAFRLSLSSGAKKDTNVER